jgi:hypothetical protein
MATVTLTAAGVGGTQSGTVTTAGGSGGGIIMVTNDSDATVTFDVATAGSTVLSNQVIAAKDYKIVSGLNNGAQTLINVSTSHGTAAQASEVIYNTLVT